FRSGRRKRVRPVAYGGSGRRVDGKRLDYYGRCRGGHGGSLWMNVRDTTIRAAGNEITVNGVVAGTVTVHRASEVQDPSREGNKVGRVCHGACVVERKIYRDAARTPHKRLNVRDRRTNQGPKTTGRGNCTRVE